MARVRAVLTATKKSVRERDLPAHVVIYHVIALEPSARVKVAGNSGISQARTRLGWEPLWRLSHKPI